MRHAVSVRQPESRNSRGEAKASTLKPNERISLRVELRMEASSSTIATRRLSATLSGEMVKRDRADNRGERGWGRDIEGYRIC
jgi:hypothetical protein